MNEQVALPPMEWVVHLPLLAKEEELSVNAFLHAGVVFHAGGHALGPLNELQARGVQVKPQEVVLLASHL